MARKSGEATRGKKGDVTVQTLIDMFILSKQVEGKSTRTIGWYRANLDSFAKFATNGEPPRLGDLTLESGRAFIAHLQGKTTRYGGHHMRPVQQGGLSPNTIHGYVRTLKAFGSWIHEEGYVQAHPFERLKAPKLPQTMIEILVEDEIARILGTIKPATYLGARAHAIFLLLLDTGIRASELCSLTLSNTYLHEGYIKVRGKGDKERIVPIGGATKKSLLRYIQMFRPQPVQDSIVAVFLTSDAQPLTYSGLSQVLNRLGKAADVPRLHAHLLRHTFAVHYLMNGGDLMTLKLLLGHTTIEVTQMYLHLAEAHVQVQHSRFSPVDRLECATRRSRKH